MKKDKNSTFVDDQVVSSTNDINPPKSINQIITEPSVSATQISDTVSFLVGRICTIIDASYPNKEQAEAVKQLVKNELYDASNKIEVWVEQMSESESNGAYPFPYWGKLAQGGV